MAILQLKEVLVKQCELNKQDGMCMFYLNLSFFSWGHQIRDTCHFCGDGIDGRGFLSTLVEKSFML